MRQRVEEEKARVEAGGEPSPVFAFLAGATEALAWMARGFFSVYVAGLLTVPVLLILPRLNAVNAAWPVWYAATYLVWWSVRPRSEHPGKTLCAVASAMLGAMFLPLVAKHAVALVSKLI